MTIDRHNYETFFLLHADNELSAAQQRALELFLQANPDLLVEWQMLQAAVLPVENMVFSGKANLIKSAASSLPTQDKWMRYLDNEMQADEAVLFQQQLTNDKSLAAEWALWQQTKLDADLSITFADKSQLYKKEKEPAKTIGWWRWSAAAAFIAMIAGAAFLFIHKNPTRNAVDVVHQSTKNSNNIADENALPAPENVAAQAIANAKNNQVVLPQQRIVSSLQKEKSAELLVKNSKASNSMIVPSNSEAIRRQENIVAQEIQPANLHKIEVVVTASLPQTIAKTNANVNAVASTGAEAPFAFDQDEPKPTRMSGLLKKATRMIVRKAKHPIDEQDLTIANFSIAVK